MNLFLTCYADDRMTISRQRLIDSVANIMNPLCNFNCFAYGHGDGFLKMNPYFCEQNKHILSQERGAGYWLFKPQIIYESLCKVNDGDYILYMDSGIELLSSVIPLLDHGQDVFLFNNEWPHVDFCKRDVLEAMLPSYNDTAQKQVQASVLLIKKNAFSLQFITEWLFACLRPGFIDDSPSVLPNFVSFRDHRHDQSILTNVALKYRIPLHWWPSVYQDGSGHMIHRHMYPNDRYGILFLHHRMRNNEY